MLDAQKEGPDPPGGAPGPAELPGRDEEPPPCREPGKKGFFARIAVGLGRSVADDAASVTDATTGADALRCADYAQRLDDIADGCGLPDFPRALAG